MLYQIIIAMLLLSLCLYGLQLMPMASTPKRLLMAAFVLLTGLSLANRAGILG